MRLVTFNMRTGRAADWEQLVRLRPDVAFVQESTGPEQLGGDLFADLPLDRFLWSGVEHGLWGSGLLLPEPAETVLEVPGYEGWVVGARAPLGPDGACWNLFSVHAPQRLSSYVRTVLEIVERIVALDLEGPILLGGDLNVLTARRVPEEERTTSPAEGRLLDRLEEALDVVNAWAVRNPGVPLAQTLRWTRSPEIPFHCDGVFVPSTWSPAVRHAEVLEGEPWLSISDHNPVVVDLDPDALPNRKDVLIDQR